MPASTWSAALNWPGAGSNWMAVAGTALSNSVTETIITPSAPDFTFNLHAPSLSIGQMVRVTIVGEFSATATPTLRLRLYYGAIGTVANVLLDSTALTAYNGSHDIWSLSALLQCRSVGTSGTIMPTGMLNGIVTNKNTQTPLSNTGSTTPAVATVDLTAQKALALSATWGTAAAGNTIQVHQCLIESLGF